MRTAFFFLFDIPLYVRSERIRPYDQRGFSDPIRSRFGTGNCPEDPKKKSKTREREQDPARPGFELLPPGGRDGSKEMPKEVKPKAKRRTLFNKTIGIIVVPITRQNQTSRINLVRRKPICYGINLVRKDTESA